MKNEKYITINNDVPLYATFVSTNIVKKAPYAMPITSLSKKGTRIRFNYDNQELWIEQNDLITLDFSSKNFSDDNLLFLETPLVNQVMWFAYKGILYTMDLTIPRNPSIKAKVKLPKISDMIPSKDRVWWLLRGTSETSNDHSLLNLALFNATNQKFIPLTILYGNNITLELAEFSQDNNFLAMLLKIDDQYIVNVYNLSNKTLCVAQDKGLGFSWNDNQLLIYTKDAIELYNASENWNDKLILYSFKIAIKETPLTRKANGNLYLTIDNTVYKLTNNILEKTDDQFIEYSKDKQLKYYEKDGITYTYYKNWRLRSLSGVNPKWTFVTFLDNKNILYKAQKGALSSIYIYNIDTEESSVFRWIENPIHLLPNYTAIEAVIEGDEVWIFIEQAGKWAKILRLHELLD